MEESDEEDLRDDTDNDDPMDPMDYPMDYPMEDPMEELSDNIIIPDPTSHAPRFNSSARPQLTIGEPNNNGMEYPFLAGSDFTKTTALQHNYRPLIYGEENRKKKKLRIKESALVGVSNPIRVKRNETIFYEYE